MMPAKVQRAVNIMDADARQIAVPWGTLWRVEYTRSEFHPRGGTHDKRYLRWIAYSPNGYTLADSPTRRDAVAALREAQEGEAS
jgi:hypothetical protein